MYERGGPPNAALVAAGPPIAGCFVETTTVEQAARVHRNRQLAAKSLRNIKSSRKDLEARSIRWHEDARRDGVIAV